MSRGAAGWYAGLGGLSCFRRVAGAAWLVGLAALAPAFVGLELRLVGPLAGVAPAADGDALLVAVSALRQQRPAILVGAAALGLLLLIWGIWWRAGVARWLVWRPQPTALLGEVLGLGLGGWWRFARLWLAGVAGRLVVGVLALAPLTAIVDQLDRGRTGVRLWLGLAGVGLAALLWALATAAWLRGCWELAPPQRRSAVAAYVRGLGSVIRRPLASLAPLLVWGGLGGVAALVPLAGGWWLPALRGGAPMAVTIVVAGMVRAAARVALLTSYADAGSSGVAEAPPRA